MRRGARLVRLDRNNHADRPVHRRRAARCRARFFGTGISGARAQSCTPRDLANRDRAILDLVAVGLDHRPGARRLSLCRVARDPLRSKRAAVRRVVPRHARHPANPPPRARPLGRLLAQDDRGNPLRPDQSTGARRDQPRPVRRAARRGDRDAAGVRPRRAPCRCRGTRQLARCARGRRDVDGGLVHLSPAQDQCRRENARRGCHLRLVDDRLWRVDLDAAQPRQSRDPWRGRHVFGQCPSVADPAPHTRRQARPGRRGQFTIHQRLKRTRRGRERTSRGADRSGRSGRRGRDRRGRGRRDLGVEISRAATCQEL